MKFQCVKPTSGTKLIKLTLTVKMNMIHMINGIEKLQK